MCVVYIGISLPLSAAAGNDVITEFATCLSVFRGTVAPWLLDKTREQQQQLMFQGCIIAVHKFRSIRIYLHPANF